MRIPFKSPVVATVAAAGAIAFSASLASASSYGWHEVSQVLTGGCAVSLEIHHPSKGVYWAYAKVGAYAAQPWTCQGYVKNSAGSKSWTPGGDGGWSGGVWDGGSQKAWACGYAYYKGVRKSSRCTSSY